MRRLTTAALALVLVAVLSSTLWARGGGNFVSIFDHPKAGVCWIDLNPVKPGQDDPQEEIEAAQRDLGKHGDFRGIRPDQVAKAHYRNCSGKGEGPKDETKG